MSEESDRFMANSFHATRGENAKLRRQLADEQEKSALLTEAAGALADQLEAKKTRVKTRDVHEVEVETEEPDDDDTDDDRDRDDDDTEDDDADEDEARHVSKRRGAATANVTAIVERSVAQRGLTGKAADEYRATSYAAHRASSPSTSDVDTVAEIRMDQPAPSRPMRAHIPAPAPSRPRTERTTLHAASEPAAPVIDVTSPWMDRFPR